MAEPLFGKAPDVCPTAPAFPDASAGTPTAFGLSPTGGPPANPDCCDCGASVTTTCCDDMPTFLLATLTSDDCSAYNRVVILQRTTISDGPPAVYTWAGTFNTSSIFGDGCLVSLRIGCTPGGWSLTYGNLTNGVGSDVNSVYSDGAPAVSCPIAETWTDLHFPTYTNAHYGTLCCPTGMSEITPTWSLRVGTPTPFTGIDCHTGNVYECGRLVYVTPCDGPGSGGGSGAIIDPDEPHTTACCPDGLPTTLYLVLSGDGDCTCLSGSYPVTWNGSGWSSVPLTFCELPGDLTLTCDVDGWSVGLSCNGTITNSAPVTGSCTLPLDMGTVTAVTCCVDNISITLSE